MLLSHSLSFSLPLLSLFFISFSFSHFYNSFGTYLPWGWVQNTLLHTGTYIREAGEWRKTDAHFYKERTMKSFEMIYISCYTKKNPKEVKEGKREKTFQKLHLFLPYFYHFLKVILKFKKKYKRGKTKPREKEREKRYFSMLKAFLNCFHSLASLR